MPDLGLALSGPGALGGGVIVLACVTVGAAIAVAPDPRFVALGVAGLATIALAGAYAGVTGLLAVVFGLVTLIPSVIGNQIADPRYEAVRSGLIGSLILLAAFSLSSGSGVRVPPSVRFVLTGFAVLAALGVAVTAYTSPDLNTFLNAAAQAGGQPLLYATLLVVLIILLQRKPESRETLVTAWCVGIILEALVVVGQYATGTAYDPIRGFARAHGTMGADFLGVFASMGIFAGAYLRTIASVPWRRHLAAVAIAAGVGSLIGSISRGALIGLAVGVFSLILGGRRSSGSRQRRIAVAIGIAIVAGGTLYLMQGFWLARLGAASTSPFDRPATWVSGFRIAVDHPLTGVGPTQVAQTVLDNPRYSDTPAGVTRSNPHNAWLFVAAAEGILYSLILFAVSIGLVTCVIRSRGSPGREFLIGGLAAAGTVFLVNNLFNHPEIMLYILLAVALLVSYAPAARAADASGTSPGP